MKYILFFLFFSPVFSAGKIYFNNKYINDIILKTDAINADKTDDRAIGAICENCNENKNFKQKQQQ